MLHDNFGRKLNYLRLAVTDRCNLRCFYCMPEFGMKFLPKKKVLSYEEMLRLASILASVGVNKVRITGGEPFVKKDIDYFLTHLAAIPGVDDLHITTNGVLTQQYIPLLEKLGFKGVNLSLDSLDKENFSRITKRDSFDIVKSTFDDLLLSKLKTKLNMVVMAGQNEHEVVAMAELALAHNIEVRFIEEMPFNGTPREVEIETWNWKRIEQELKSHFGDLIELPAHKSATTKLLKSPKMKGTLGIIPAYSRTFCGTCNRIRITASGLLKTCLYDNGVMDLKELLRTNISDAQVLNEMKRAFRNRAKDGFEAERSRNNSPIEESMASIGG